MSNNVYSEKELIFPALYEIYKNKGRIMTKDLIDALIETLEPGEEDMKILFGRNDTKFSQKVRNLVSHNTLCPQYANYVKEENGAYLILNDKGKKYLQDSQYFLTKENQQKNGENNQEDDEEDDDKDFEGNRSLGKIEDFDFMQTRYINIENINMSVYELKRKYDKTAMESKAGIASKNGLILNETFQRTGKVWSNKKQSQLIESILMDMPIPFIYLAEGDNGNLVVVDGRQRLTALFKFLDNKLKLSDLAFFPELKGRRKIDLKEEQVTKIEDAHLFIIKIKKSTPEPLKLQIFSRVNKNGVPLNSQEIRHALYQGFITELLEGISDKYNILIAKNRMKDRYLALRYIAFRLYFLGKLCKYNEGQKKEAISYSNIDDFLGNAMEAINTFSEEQIKEIKEDFEYSYNKALQILGVQAFRLKEKASINMIWFEVTLLIISLCKNKIKDDNIPQLLENFKNYDKDNLNEDGETPFYQNIKYHRDSKENFNKRIFWIGQTMEVK